MNEHKYTSELISEYIDGELSEAERVEFEVHLAECEDCRREVELLRSISRLTGEALAEPPESLVRGVMASVKQERTKKRLKFFRAAGVLAASLAVVLVARFTVFGGMGGSNEGSANDLMLMNATSGSGMNDGAAPGSPADMPLPDPNDGAVNESTARIQTEADDDAGHDAPLGGAESDSETAGNVEDLEKAVSYSVSIAPVSDAFEPSDIEEPTSAEVVPTSLGGAEVGGIVEMNAVQDGALAIKLNNVTSFSFGPSYTNIISPVEVDSDMPTIEYLASRQLTPLSDAVLVELVTPEPAELVSVIVRFDDDTEISFLYSEVGYIVAEDVWYSFDVDDAE